MIAQLLPPSDWTPGTFPALPYGSPVPFYVHPHLIYNPNNPSVPVLQWDILHSAEVARIFTGRHSVIPVDLKAEAIFPVVNKVYIVTDHPILARWMERWGPIVAEADRITVRDVLDAIHEYFEQPLTRRDIQTIKAIPGNYTDLVYAAHRRVAEAYQLTTLGLRTGFRRLDAIGGHRRFQGLRPVVYQNRTWKLFLGLLPGPVPAVY
ncbi:hypothetical protein BDQ17DRAFT_1341718 [Cyathus striatus]|nr:hypothetical protein BDQ17DRAFT_1341718 [Cyathus striatus]